MKIGYARVSTDKQSLIRQTDQLTQAGCARIFMEKISGGSADRPELQKMLDMVRPGDTIVVSELSRLSRSVKDLFSLIETLHTLGADIRSLKESWADTTTPQGKLLFAIFAGVSEFERDLIRQRTKEGLAAARTRGHFGGRPKTAADKINLALRMYRSESADSYIYSIAEITKATGISKTTLYKYLHLAEGKTELE